VETIDQITGRRRARMRIARFAIGHWQCASNRIAHPMRIHVRITVKTPSPSARGRKRKHVTEKKTSRDATEPN
jgi:hypothetical protein